MFTGLIEEVGRVRRVDRQGPFQRLQIDAARILEDLRIGDSINIDGACQTAVDVGPSHFSVETVEETLARTTLGSFQAGRPVNLERALRAGDRLGGHLVQGHVDGVGRIAAMQQGHRHWRLAIEPPPELERYIATKGSIAIDGISLTVAAAGDGAFTVAVIPHTFEHTALMHRRTGESVNLEIDIVARYVERLLHRGGDQELSFERLREMGY